MIFHSAGIGVQKVADHKYAVLGITRMFVATIGTTKRHHHGSCWFVEPKIIQMRLQHYSKEKDQHGVISNVGQTAFANKNRLRCRTCRYSQGDQTSRGVLCTSQQQVVKQARTAPAALDHSVLGHVCYHNVGSM